MDEIINGIETSMGGTNILSPLKHIFDYNYQNIYFY